MPEAEITDDHRDVAAALQECLDEVILHLCEYAGRATGLRRLALAGGVALNCTANGKLLQSGSFDEIYVQPAAGDDGSALGAALWRASRGGAVRNARMPVPFLGPAPSGKDIDEALEEFQDAIEIVRLSTLGETCSEAAKLIRDGRVIAWYRGRMEFGPRALGHRSILADSGNPEMRRPNQCHGKDARSLPAVRTGCFARAGAGLVQDTSLYGIAVHDRDRRRPG